ncbi:1,4-beta-D-xylan synthase protein [Dioscorea alata]|uniref:1,4-beta-D-xylan synthase protein n=1 Tax=Dioscorea alata TaxID=55571 RepID=A0ACB7VE81_DIOAL|nr:1,4-beta-D-xylan synthase protein [Dioscorea alata]
MAEFRAGRRMSLMRSTKAPPDFDHNRWLFETKEREHMVQVQKSGRILTDYWA